MVSLKRIGWKTILKFAVFIAIIIALSIVLWKPLMGIVSDKEAFRQYILGYGAWTPIIFIAFSALQVLVAPIPGQIVGIGGGYIFGWFWGTIYSMIGLIIGSYIAFMLGRILGRPFVEKLVGKRNIEKFDDITKESGAFTLFIIYLLPWTPDDIASLIAGLTNIRISTLMILSAIGRTPGMLLLALMGQGILSANDTTGVLIIILIAILSLVLFIYRRQLEELSMKIKDRFVKPPQ